MIYTLNLKYDVEESRKYLEILNEKFYNLHWFYRKHHNEPRVIEKKNAMDDVHGWGLQTIYDDQFFPYHCDIDPHNETAEYFKDTPMVFGFFYRFKNLFKNPYRSFLMNFPGHHHIGKWLPTKPLHGKIFLPIYSNEESVLITYSQPMVQMKFEVGKIYLIDMTTHHGEFRNDGDSKISFITFNVLPETFNKILELQGTV